MMYKMDKDIEAMKDIILRMVITNVRSTRSPSQREIQAEGKEHRVPLNNKCGYV